MSGTTDPALIAITANSARNLAHFRAPVIQALNGAGYRVAAIAPDDGIRIDGVDVQIDLAMDRGGTNPIRDWATIRAYRDAFRQLSPRAVLGFTPKANIYGGVAATTSGLPFIPTVSGLGTAFLKGGMVRSIQGLLYRRAFSTCPMVLFQNADDRDLFLASRFATPDQARLVPGSGVDIRQFTPLPTPGKPRLEFLFIGRLLADKGVRELAEAARLLRSSGVRFGLTIVGDIDHGNPTTITQAELLEWQAEGLLHWAGSRADVRPLIAAADVVVLPSYREGLPRALLEAAAMGRPMVATDVPGCRELVIDGETGLLCRDRDAASLAQAMAEMAQMSADDRAAMGQRARLMVETSYDASMVGQRYLDLLREVML